MSHFAALLFASFFVSLAFAFLMRTETRERIVYGLKMFFGLVGFSVLAAWILYFLPWW
jgi:hypothetical protein